MAYKFDKDGKLSVKRVHNGKDGSEGRYMYSVISSDENSEEEVLNDVISAVRGFGVGEIVTFDGYATENKQVDTIMVAGLRGKRGIKSEYHVPKISEGNIVFDKSGKVKLIGVEKGVFDEFFKALSAAYIDHANEKDLEDYTKSRDFVLSDLKRFLKTDEELKGEELKEEDVNQINIMLGIIFDPIAFKKAKNINNNAKTKVHTPSNTSKGGNRTMSEKNPYPFTSYVRKVNKEGNNLFNDGSIIEDVKLNKNPPVVLEGVPVELDEITDENNLANDTENGGNEDASVGEVDYSWLDSLITPNEGAEINNQEPENVVENADDSNVNNEESQESGFNEDEAIAESVADNGINDINSATSSTDDLPDLNFSEEAKAEDNITADGNGLNADSSEPTPKKRRLFGRKKKEVETASNNDKQPETWGRTTKKPFLKRVGSYFASHWLGTLVAAGLITAVVLAILAVAAPAAVPGLVAGVIAFATKAALASKLTITLSLIAAAALVSGRVLLFHNRRARRKYENKAWNRKREAEKALTSAEKKIYKLNKKLETGKISNRSAKRELKSIDKEVKKSQTAYDEFKNYLGEGKRKERKTEAGRTKIIDEAKRGRGIAAENTLNTKGLVKKTAGKLQKHTIENTGEDERLKDLAAVLKSISENNAIKDARKTQASEIEKKLKGYNTSVEADEKLDDVSVPDYVSEAEAKRNRLKRTK